MDVSDHTGYNEIICTLYTFTLFTVPGISYFFLFGEELSDSSYFSIKPPSAVILASSLFRKLVEHLRM